MRARETEPGEWQALRAFRLRALASDPLAFGATLGEEEAKPDAWWQAAAEGAPDRAVLVAQDEGEGAWLGMCGIVTKERAADLWGMWVAPEARGRGVARVLLEAAVERARRAGAHELALWVNVAQRDAVRVYEREGFAPSGLAQRGTRDPTRTFLPMKRAL